MITLAIQKRSLQSRQLSTIHETVRFCCEHSLNNRVEIETVKFVLNGPVMPDEVVIYLNIGEKWHQSYQDAKQQIEVLADKSLPTSQIISILMRHYLATP